MLQRVAARAFQQAEEQSAPERQLPAFHGRSEAGEALDTARQPSLSSSYTAVTGAVLGASSGRAATPTPSSLRAGGSVKRGENLVLTPNYHNLPDTGQLAVHFLAQKTETATI